MNKSNNNSITFTDMEKRILDLLSDGRRHRCEEFYACCTSANRSTIQKYMSVIRQKLVVKGEDVLCVLYIGTLFYQHVRLLCGPGQQDVQRKASGLPRG